MHAIFGLVKQFASPVEPFIPAPRLTQRGTDEPFAPVVALHTLETSITMSVHDSYTEVDIHFTKDRSKMRSREVAYESIKNAILRGILAPRERLVEERLGDALQISRTPIREALSIL